jgi:Ca2+-binding EF-hand superfamily protein
VHRYKTTRSSGVDLEKSNASGLREIIFKKKSALLSSFEAVDKHNTGRISRTEWSRIMQNVTSIYIRWLSLITQLVPAEGLDSSSVDYQAFLKSYSVNIPADAGTDAEISTLTLDQLYGQREKLESIFAFFDSNGDGIISHDEFVEACDKLNESLDESTKLTNIENTLLMMDLTGSGAIDINELFETFRMIDKRHLGLSADSSRADSPRAGEGGGMARTRSMRWKKTMSFRSPK